jgi:hypothetical protein
VEVANQKEIDQPYIAAYPKRQTNYITSYGTKKDVEGNYVAKYGTKNALKDSEMKNKEHVSLCFSDIYAYYTVFKVLHFVKLILIWILVCRATNKWRWQTKMRGTNPT